MQCISIHATFLLFLPALLHSITQKSCWIGILNYCFHLVSNIVVSHIPRWSLFVVYRVKTLPLGDQHTAARRVGLINAVQNESNLRGTMCSKFWMPSSLSSPSLPQLLTLSHTHWLGPVTGPHLPAASSRTSTATSSGLTYTYYILSSLTHIYMYVCPMMVRCKLSWEYSEKLSLRKAIDPFAQVFIPKNEVLLLLIPTG